MRTQGATFVAAALFLVAAAPASAVTGFGVAKAIHGGPLPVILTDTAKGKRATACHSSGPKSSGTAKSTGIAEQIGQKAAPVACEQPPRSDVLSRDALNKATAAALAVIG